VQAARLRIVLVEILGGSEQHLQRLAVKARETCRRSRSSALSPR
jgi:hypothetical protein